jgi:hypothetical protein
MRHIKGPGVAGRMREMTNIFDSNDDEQDTAGADNRVGSPSSWSVHPCDAHDWSNDEDGHDGLVDERGSPLVPCNGGQRPLDGRPDGFRPGPGVVNKLTSGTANSSTSSGPGMTAGAIASASFAAVAAIFFLVAWKLSRKGTMHKGAGAAAASDDNVVTIASINADDTAAIINDMERFGGYHLGSSVVVGAPVVTSCTGNDTSMSYDNIEIDRIVWLNADD